ncbi:hypothetical protein CDD81_5437 [Ophiocordyceps australis]|uniref:1-phosphatidylinositol 4-kinase n=1 Tax=Ophiocordyceps australis TaxID=1399860 RepID=A0A2C5Y8L8_9HYPO|nr:hypothetical protein CDD81_5437 [Ophiocordyceps australis]
MTRDIRAKALDKIASLSAAEPATASFDLAHSDLDKLCNACHSGSRRRSSHGAKQKDSLHHVPMSTREFQVLLALCKAASSVQSSQGAQKLVYQLLPYLLEAHSQVFDAALFARHVEPSPTESLAFHVAAALLALGRRYTEVRETVTDGIWAFANSCGRATEAAISPRAETSLESELRTATLALALVGFLDATSAQTDFWKAGGRLGLAQKLRQVLSEPFLVAVETSLSTIRNSHSQDAKLKQWRHIIRHYAWRGRPLGAMLLQRSFTWLVLASTSLLIAPGPALTKTHVLDLVMAGGGNVDAQTGHLLQGDFRSIEVYASLCAEQMDYIDAGADFIRLSSTPTQQAMTYAVKSAALITFMNCALLNDNAADPEVLMTWLHDTLEDPAQMADEGLASVVLRCLALVCHVCQAFSQTVSRLLPRFLVQAAPSRHTARVASESLAFVLKALSKDAVISTLYTLGNVLSPQHQRSILNGHTNGAPEGSATSAPIYAGRHSTGSSISLQMDGEVEAETVYSNVVQAICHIAAACQDEKITALAQSMLLQKLDKVNARVDAQVISGAASLALHGGQVEFRALLKTYSRICHIGIIEDKNFLLAAIMKARTHISAHLPRDSPLFEIYWEHLLDSIISLGDADGASSSKESDVRLVAQEIGELLLPLAVLMSSNDLASEPLADDEAYCPLRDVWFNIVVHGFGPGTDRSKMYMDELRIIAIHSPPLITGERIEQVESDVELNTVLRRGGSSEREVAQRKLLSELIPSKSAEIKGLSYRKVMFLQAAYLVETLRAESGDCTQVLSYFLEPSMRKGEVSSTMEAIASVVMDKYLDKTLGGVEPAFSAQYAATQLASMFCMCCHRIDRVQQAAFGCADRIIREVPSALCSRSSLFTLLELLSLMWSGCLETETDPYSPKSVFYSELGNVKVELSDDYKFRRSTLDRLNSKAKAWVNGVINLAPLDVKGLLQTYLSEFQDEGTYGHISLGRSFAIELGSVTPTTDNRLQSLERVGDCSINTASDLIAQYTTRQEYRYGETLPDRGYQLVSFMSANRRPSFKQTSAPESANASTALAHVEARILSNKTTSLGEVRDILRRAAALLCRNSSDECAVARYLVSIPFALFTKQSIKLGVSLWLGVMNENPRLEPKLLNSIAQQWEYTVNRRVGLFSPALGHGDPFFRKQEFAPSDMDNLAKRRQAVHDMLSPHTRLMHFFASHFNATRLGSVDTQRVLTRMLNVTMDAMKLSASHPMARELRFQIVLFGLGVLHASPTMGATAQWKLKDKTLSAGLDWFRNPPRWSFGSNIVQIKTEIRLISEVLEALRAVSFIGCQSVGSAKSLQPKEQLLGLLLENEQARLSVWINPLNQHVSHFPLHHTSKTAVESRLLALVRTAWVQDAAIAIELATRFYMPRLHREVRLLLLGMPDKAVSEPEALPLLFGGQLPDDVNSQLKYLLYWQPVNPLTAVTMFAPSYKDHPLIIQYAMRTLESHTVDVTFFYVPQIVQTLRYDSLGYVERFILETAQFSQLFAHQIIWNMKANSYKDDDSQVPDDMKPTLDRVMGRMVQSLTVQDCQFYEREFSFFDEVTGISGKLKPLIKRPKPDKKQKIEEELRKIKVEVGVYLPSNPDGVVIGIDRKSGKPLQSHAKAPYMATFRIRKSLKTEQDDMTSAQQDPDQPQVVEVWQSAIFKVGDDCRQDVLALQMIAAFRGIFHHVGLDVYVFPYRVTATAPGCGVIDVLPNSVSRDMLGREAVNGLYDYFVSKYGSEDSLRFQRARSNFVKSMAAYSVISFLLQFKDRHNGNIMIDDGGHILHIDFGFCFDIAPGGIKFERAPFKLTAEMVAVMGGSTDHQAFRAFEELCVKAFLASRQYCDKLSQLVLLMMDSGLPCFRPESVRHFRERFVLDKSEAEAADFMKDLIKKSYSSYSTGIYDQFQLLTNGIPY